MLVLVAKRMSIVLLPHPSIPILLRQESEELFIELPFILRVSTLRFCDPPQLRGFLPEPLPGLLLEPESLPVGPCESIVDDVVDSARRLVLVDLIL